MNNEDLETYIPLPLAYNAPHYDENISQLIPHVSYNAFPDLNERGKDKLYTEPPNGAKYLWPLGCIFNPYGVFKSVSEGHDLCGPRDPKLEEPYRQSHYFELIHARLAVTDKKVLLRNRALGPFYSELYNAITSGDMIEVPLIPDPAGSKLQQTWSFLQEMFRHTLIYDEAISMLATVALCGTMFEKRWVEQEERHIEGFADFYSKVKEIAERSFGKLEACNTSIKQSTWATNVILLGRLIIYSNAYPKPVDEANFDRIEGAIIERYDADDPVKKEILVFEKEDIARYRLRATTMWERIQDVLECYLLVVDADTDISDTALNVPFSCEITTASSLAKTYISLLPSGDMIDFVGSIFFKEDGPARFEAAIYIVLRMVFLEALRQQMCHGVGLRCPFWEGKCCKVAEFKGFLNHFYKRTKPWNPMWQHHWQPPPCLD